MFYGVINRSAFICNAALVPVADVYCGESSSFETKPVIDIISAVDAPDGNGPVMVRVCVDPMVGLAKLGEF